MIKLTQIDDNLSVYKENTVVLLGLGQGTKQIFDMFKHHKINVAFICDNNAENVGKFLDGVQVISPDMLQQLTQSKTNQKSRGGEIVVQFAVKNIGKGVMEQLIHIGVDTIINYDEACSILKIIPVIKDVEAINIMTSCDHNLAPLLFTQLNSISKFFKSKKVNFFLFQSQYPENAINSYKEYCNFLGNITFYNIYVGDNRDFNIMALHGGRWPAEAYYSLLCHEYLPESIERILYIDAGDVIFFGEDRDIDEFYYCDFKDNLIIAGSSGWFNKITSENTKIKRIDLENANKLANYAKGTFGSGSFVLNLQGFRKENINNNSIINIINKTCEVLAKGDLSIDVLGEIVDAKKGVMKYIGDQGLLSIVFVERIIFFDIENKKSNVCYAPYHFVVNAQTGLEYQKQIIEISQQPPYIIHLHVPKPFHSKHLRNEMLGSSNELVLNQFYEYYDKCADEVKQYFNKHK